MYDGATYFAWFVIALLFFVAVGFIVWLGSQPKKIAMRRNHPQVDAINACSWIGLACGGVGWPVAFIWAFLRSGSVGYDSADNETQLTSQLRSEIEVLKAKVAELEQERSPETSGN